MKGRPGRANQRGVTLIETVVSSGIFLLALGAAFGFLQVSVGSVREVMLPGLTLLCDELLVAGRAQTAAD